MNLGDIIAVLFAAILLFVLTTHAYPGVIAASWVPTRKKDYRRIVEAMGPLEGGRVADLGAGGGGVMRAVARANPQAHVVGYEISILAWSTAQLLNNIFGLGSRGEMRYKNFYKENLGEFDVIYCFLTPMAMKRLKDKFERELKPGAKVVSYAFQVPGWEGKALRELGKVPIFVYSR